MPRLIAGDATPEALAALLFRQHERLCIASAEGGEVFSLASGRYGNRPAPEELLRGWSCDQVSIDRKTSDPVTLREPALQVVLAVQPDVIRGVGDVDPTDPRPGPLALAARADDLERLACLTEELPVGERRAIGSALGLDVAGRDPARALVRAGIRRLQRLRKLRPHALSDIANNGRAG